MRAPEHSQKERKECAHQPRGKHHTKVLSGIFKGIHDTENHCSLPTRNTSPFHCKYVIMLDTITRREGATQREPTTS